MALPRVRIWLLSGVALLTMPSAAFGQAIPVPEADQPAEAPPEQKPGSAIAAAEEPSEEIVVTGTRRSLENALATRRNALGVVDSISAEGIGRLPDLNLAESLQRLPGVQINRSASRRGGTVSIRGLPGDFSQTLINGQYLASPDVSNFQFGLVRSEVFSGIDVQKAASPENLTGGLSGLVNLRTGTPLRSSDQLTLTVDARYEELPKSFSPGGAIVFSKQLIPGTLGVRLAVGYKNLDFREDSALISAYDRVAGSATPDGTDDLFTPRTIRIGTNVTKGNSYSGSGAIEWQASDTLNASVSLFYNEYKPSSYVLVDQIDPRATSTITTLATTDEGGRGRTRSSLLVINPNLQTDSRIIDEHYRTGALTGRLGWKDSGWAVDGVVHYTKAKRDFVNYGFQAQQQPSPTGNNGLSVLINTGSGDIGAFAYDLQTGSPRINLEQPFGAPFGPTFRQVNATANPLHNFIGGYRNSNESEDELAFQVDVKRELNLGPLRSANAGAIYRDKSQDQRNSLQTLFGADLSGLNNSLYNYSFLTGSGAFLGGRAGFFDPADIAEFDVRRVLDLITPVTASNLPANMFVGPGGLVALIDTTSISQIYDNTQKIYGGYAELELEQEIGSNVRLRGEIGVRYEKSERNTVARNAANQPVPSDFKYDNWLPSANFVVDLFDEFVVRASYSKTLRRPQVDSFAVLRSVAVDGTGALITANLGAADLKPFTSDNLDLALEWYNRKGSAIIFTLFQKKVKDYAGTTRLCPEDGGGFGFGPLTNATGVCRTVNATPAGNGFPAVIAGARADINVTANQSDFTLKGFEASIQQNLDFLPEPFNGLGGQVNYTRIDFSTSSTFRLSEISKHTVNAIIYYETPSFGVRAAYNWRSKYFSGSTGTFAGSDSFVDARPQLDLSAQVNLTDRLSASFEAFNVTDEELYQYEGPKTRARNYAVYGRTYSAGLSYRF